jgi:hypothetical protein
MDNTDVRLCRALPYGQYMARADQLAIEVHYVPLPADELEDRRAHLRALLLRGALRVMRQQHPSLPSLPEADPVEITRK